jgi:soluble cytochrome b562
MASMSSTVQATSTTSSTSNIQLITDALLDYAKVTGIDLSKNPFAAAIERANSPGAILELLQEREKEFKDYREGNRRLISCLRPAVNTIQAFSGVLGTAVSLVPFPPAKALFVGIDVLLSAASGVTSSYDALLDLFECLGNFLKRLEVYTTIPHTPPMMDLIVKIMVQLLSVLALASKQVKQGRLKKFTKKLLGESEIETILRRLDRLTQDEARMTVTQTLGVVHGLMGNIKVVMEDGKASTDSIRDDLATIHQTLNKVNKTQRLFSLSVFRLLD